MSDVRPISTSPNASERAKATVGTPGMADGIDANADDECTVFDTLAGPPVINPPSSLVNVDGPTPEGGNQVTMMPVRTRSQDLIPNPSSASNNSANPRSAQQRSELTGKDYPPPSAFDNVGWLDALSLFADAPWVQRDAVVDTELLRCYVDSRGWLPGKVPLEVTENAVWREQFCYSDAWLWVGHRRDLTSAKKEFVRQAYSGYDRLKTFNVVPAELGLDMFLFRTRGEESYARRLAAVSTETVDAYRGVFDVEQSAMLLDGALLRIEFRYVKVPPIFKEYCRHERKARSSHGLAVPYQCLTLYSMKRSECSSRWPEVTANWRDVEVPQGCFANLPAMFSYLGSEMIDDPESGWWVFAFTEWAVRVAVFLLQEVYDTYRVWAISPTLIGFIRKLDTSVPLGCGTNVEELRSLLDVIENTDFRRLPVAWRRRTSRVNDASPGRIGEGADFVYYDPFSRKLIDQTTAERRRRMIRSVPPGHPVGYEYGQDVAGWGGEYGATAGNNDPRELALDRGGWVEPAVVDVPNPYAGAVGVTDPDVSMDQYQQPVQESNVDVVKRFLHEAGVPDGLLTGGWDELRGLIRGRLSYGRD